MKCFWHHQYPNIRRTGGAIALATVLAIGGLALKPASLLNAGVSESPTGNQQAKVQATAATRSQHRDQQTRQIRPDNYDVQRFPVTNQHESHWRNILWTTAVVEPQEAFVADSLSQILSLMTRRGLSDSQMRTIDMAVKVGTQLYLVDRSLYAGVKQQFIRAVEQSADPEWVAASLSGLAKFGLTNNELQRLIAQVKRRFPNWSRNVHLQTTVQDIQATVQPPALPPLADLLTWTIAPKQLHAYAICRSDRDVLCRLILKDRNGEFIRQGGQLWSVPLLLRSIHNLNWNFVRGQTPQGIYRIEGSVPQPDDEFFRAYGQFSLVNLYVPFETGARQFLPGRSGHFTGSLTDYLGLLPPSWRNYWAIQQTFWAGKIGRSLFRIHGTGDSPDFFSRKAKNPDSFNWNPTIGCLSALELYNEQGQLLEADMPKILKAFEMVGGRNYAGYLVVVDVPGDIKTPIALGEIEAMLPPAKTAANPKNNAKSQKSGKPQAPAKPAKSTQPSKPPAKAKAASTQPTASRVVQLNSVATLPNAAPIPANLPATEPAATELSPIPIAY
ncbi:hypothetical protein ACN4EK_18865 [Pantanalinema rosaneae CENA516]|uniref:hypothetical protein n=1 Tax=Pantanalinema rosaneae TaxID=1620701 RepID=UPI003D6F48FE